MFGEAMTRQTKLDQPPAILWPIDGSPVMYPKCLHTPRVREDTSTCNSII